MVTNWDDFKRLCSDAWDFIFMAWCAVFAFTIGFIVPAIVIGYIAVKLLGK